MKEYILEPTQGKIVLSDEAVEYISKIKAMYGEPTTGAALRRIIREHGDYESLKEQGRLRIKAE